MTVDASLQERAGIADPARIRELMLDHLEPPRSTTDRGIRARRPPLLSERKPTARSRVQIARSGAGTATKKLRAARGLGFGYPPLDGVKLAEVDRFALWSGSEFAQVS